MRKAYQTDLSEEEWLGQNRRMSKDFERLPKSEEAFIYVAMCRLMLRRVARSYDFSVSF